MAVSPAPLCPYQAYIYMSLLLSWLHAASFLSPHPKPSIQLQTLSLGRATSTQQAGQIPKGQNSAQRGLSPVRFLLPYQDPTIHQEKCQLPKDCPGKWANPQGGSRFLNAFPSPFSSRNKKATLPSATLCEHLPGPAGGWSWMQLLTCWAS